MVMEHKTKKKSFNKYDCVEGIHSPLDMIPCLIWDLIHLNFSSFYKEKNRKKKQQLKNSNLEGGGRKKKRKTLTKDLLCVKAWKGLLVVYFSG